MDLNPFLGVNPFLALIPLVVGADLLAYPDLQGDALQAQVEGDVRHAARVALGGAGFLVDLLWAEPQVRGLLGLAIGNEVRRAQAQRGTTAVLSPVAVPAGSIASLPYVTFIDPPRGTNGPPAG